MTLTEHLAAEGIVHIVDGRAHLFTGPVSEIEVSQYRFTQGTAADVTTLTRSGPRPFAYIEPSGRTWILSYESGVVLLAGRKPTAAQEVAAEVLVGWLTAEHGVAEEKPKKAKKASAEVVEVPEPVEVEDE